MATPYFYHYSLELGDHAIHLSPSESAHALQSRRLTTGSKVGVINGRGLKAIATIAKADRRKVALEIHDITTFQRPNLELWVAVAFPKGDRQKVMIDMLCQLAVSRVIPLTTEYSNVSVKESHIEKLERIAIGACKQSQNPWLMEIDSTVTFDSMLESGRSTFYADQNGATRPTLNSTESQALVFVGPEGGFSDTEFMALKAHGAQGFTLSNHILRTETAAVAAASAFNEFL